MKKITKAVLIALAMLTARTAVAAPAEPIVLKFKASNPHDLLVVDMVIDGKKHKMIFDTGAERTMLCDKHTEEREVPVALGDTPIGKAVVVFQGSGYANVFKAIDDAGADGLLGEDIIRRFKGVAIDYKGHTITLTP